MTTWPINLEYVTYSPRKLVSFVSYQMKPTLAVVQVSKSGWEYTGGMESLEAYVSAFCMFLDFQMLKPEERIQI